MARDSETTSRQEVGGDLDALLATYAGTSDGAPGSCPYPVNEPMIHHWCDAIGDRNPVYLDGEAASKSVHGGLVAPPAMLQAWTMRGLRPDTPEEAAARQAAGGAKSVLQVLDEAGYTSVVATNCEQEYFRYLVPGDRLTHTVEIESVSAEKKTGLGIGRFVTQLYTFRDQRREIVGTMRFRILKFKPPQSRSTDAARGESTRS